MQIALGIQRLLFCSCFRVPTALPRIFVPSSDAASRCPPRRRTHLLYGLHVERDVGGSIPGRASKVAGSTNTRVPGFRSPRKPGSLKFGAYGPATFQEWTRPVGAHHQRNTILNTLLLTFLRRASWSNSQVPGTFLPRQTVMAVLG